MNSKIIKLNQEQMPDFADIAIKAYPGAFIPGSVDRDEIIRKFNKVQTEEPDINTYGLYRDDKLVGGMRLFDFIMRFADLDMKTGGVGTVAVHLLHKKEQVCKEMIEFFLRHYKDRGYAMAALYPFRPDFYKKMGFGYGAKLNQYRIKPGSFPCHGSKEHIEFLKEDDMTEMLLCHDRYRLKTHGLMRKTANDSSVMFAPDNFAVGYKKDNIIRGYAIMRFAKSTHDNFMINDLIIDELVYESPEVLIDILTFLNSQSDQVRDVIYNTHDDNFHYLPGDVRNGAPDLIRINSHQSNVQGVGIMYRVIDVKGVFDALKEHNFGGHGTCCTVRFNIHDNFFKENSKDVTVQFDNGKAQVIGGTEYDVEVLMDISDFSSLIIGAVNFQSLYKYGLAKISAFDESFVGVINQIFALGQKPMCTSRF